LGRLPIKKTDRLEHGRGIQVEPRWAEGTGIGVAAGVVGYEGIVCCSRVHVEGAAIGGNGRAIPVEIRIENCAGVPRTFRHDTWLMPTDFELASAVEGQKSALEELQSTIVLWLWISCAKTARRIRGDGN